MFYGGFGLPIKIVLLKKTNMHIDLATGIIIAANVLISLRS